MEHKVDVLDSKDHALLVHMMEGSRVKHEDVLKLGQHKGRHINYGYLKWVLKYFPESSPWRKAAADALTIARDQIKQKRTIHNYNVSLLTTDLKACCMRGDLHWGRTIHAKAVTGRKDSNMYVVTALIKMYANCGSIEEARCVFNSIQEPDVVSWTILLMGYADNGEGLVALDLFSRMKTCGHVPDSVTYVAALKACTCQLVNGKKKECLQLGRKIHSEIGCHLDHYVQNLLIDMYAKCSSMVEARCVFESIQEPDVVSWNALLSGYAENGDGLTALELFSRIEMRGCKPNSATYIAALKACASLATNGNKEDCLKLGREVHSKIGFQLDQHVNSSLIDMYAKCGSMMDACVVFNSIHKPHVVSWNAMLFGYAENGEALVALEFLSRMKASGCLPDSITYVGALKACTYLEVCGDFNGRRDPLELGIEIHSEIVLQRGFQLDRYMQSTLIDMYAKCNSMVDARRVFDSVKNPDVVSWTALLLGYVENGESKKALDLFSSMKACQCVPNSVTHVTAIKACGSVGALELGRQFHTEIVEFSAHVVTCLVDLYAKCGSMVEAREVFDCHSNTRDVSTWNALLAGYASFGDSYSVFSLFEAMQDEGFQPAAITFVCMLLCCSHEGLIEKAKGYLEAMPVQYGVTPTVMHYNCMVDVLGRRNQLDEAIVLMREMPCNPDAVTWNALLAACRKWKNVEMGRMAFLSAMGMEKKGASAYVLMAHLYSSRGFGGEAYVMDGLGKMLKFDHS